MKFLRDKITIVLLFIFPCSSFSITAETVDNVLSHIFEAKQKFYKKIQDIELAQDITFLNNGKYLSAKCKTYKKGEKYRVATESTGIDGKVSRQLVIYDSLNFWMVNDGIKKKIKNSDSLRTEIVTQKYLLNELPKKAKIVPNQSSDSIVCLTFSKSFMNKVNISKLWINVTDTTIEKVNLHPNDSVSILFSKWREITNGCKIPFHISLYINDILNVETVTTAVKFNTGMDDSLFDSKREKGINWKEVIKNLFH